MLDMVFFTVSMSPESAVRPPWREIVGTPHGKANIVVFAVDEAHTIVDWLVIDRSILWYNLHI